MKLRDLSPGVWEGKPLKVKNLYDPKDLADALDDKRKITAQTVKIYSQSGAIVSKRTIMQREDIEQDIEPLKAGFVPYIKNGSTIEMLFMIPSDPNFGGTQPQIAKGNVDEDEDARSAAFREANEEIGLKPANMVPETVVRFWEGNLSGGLSTYPMIIYVGEVKNKKDFDKPGYETKRAVWLTPEKFDLIGRPEQKTLISKVAKHIQ